MKQLFFSRKTLIFLAAFIGMVLLDYLLFVGIFSQISHAKAAWLMDNILLSLLLFFALFAIIPGTVAYLITFKFHKKEGENNVAVGEEPLLEENKTIEKNQDTLKFTLVASLILGLVLLFLVKVVLKPQFAHYSLQRIDESEFVEPIPIHELAVFSLEENGQLVKLTSFSITTNDYFGDLTPIMDKKDNIYIGSRDKIVKYSLSSQKSEEIFSENTGETIYNFSLSDAADHLYVTEKPPALSLPADNNSSGMEEKLIIKDVNLKDNSVRVIGPHQPVYYGNLDYLFKSSAGDVIASFGGDGCGGYGEIVVYKNSIAKKIAKTGAGCSPDSRYIGSIKEKNAILLASTVPGFEGGFKSDEKIYDTLYLQNITTGEKEIVFDLKTIKDGTLILNSTEKMVGILTDEDFLTISLETKQIEQRITLNKKISIPWISWLDNNKIYGIDYQKNFVIIDLSSGKLKILPWDKNVVTYDPHLLGLWHSKPLFYLVYPNSTTE
ncbi:hypothetical protein HY404_01715 [Candidatus Microgenomates bacterium]|nr:hypothetical protein [Candidatus Microgenomates bacterium]